MFTFLFSSDRFGTCTMCPQAAPLLSPCVFVYFRGAQKPNARLGYNHASLAATLDIRICTSCNTFIKEILDLQMNSLVTNDY